MLIDKNIKNLEELSNFGIEWCILRDKSSRFYKICINLEDDYGICFFINLKYKSISISGVAKSYFNYIIFFCLSENWEICTYDNTYGSDFILKLIVEKLNDLEKRR